MKKLITIFWCFPFFNFIHAQPTLTADNMPAIGDTYKMHKIDAKDIDAGASGAARTWTFNALPEGDTWDLVVVAATSIPASSDFPEADIVIRNNYFGPRGLSNPDKNYHFYQTNTNELIKVGRVDSGSTFSLVNHFGDLEVQYHYPVTFNASNNDNWNGGFYSPLIGTVAWNDGVTKYTADAYGTLVLNGKTINNVLRIKRERSYTSSLGGSQKWEKTMYEWYTPSIPFPVLTLVHATVNGGGDAYEGYYMDAANLQLVGREELTENLYQMQVYPNPAENRIMLAYHLDKTSRVLIAVSDLTGKTLMEYNEGIQTAGNVNRRLDMGSLEAGLYLVTLTIDDTKLTHKISIR